MVYPIILNLKTDCLVKQSSWCPKTVKGNIVKTVYWRLIMDDSLLLVQCVVQWKEFMTRQKSSLTGLSDFQYCLSSSLQHLILSAMHMVLFSKYKFILNYSVQGKIKIQAQSAATNHSKTKNYRTAFEYENIFYGW